MTDQPVTKKKPTQAQVNAAILERLDQMDRRFDERPIELPKPPSRFLKVCAWARERLVLIVFMMIVVFLCVDKCIDKFWTDSATVTQTTIEQKAASEVADISFPKRRAYADALRTAADRIAADSGNTAERLAANEDVRTAGAMLLPPGKAQRIGEALATMVQSTDSLTYAEALRRAAEGIEK